MGIILIGGTSGASADVDATPKASRVIIYDSAGNVLDNVNRGAVAETSGGLLNAGKDYKLARTFRVGSTGGLQVAGDETIMLADNFESTTRDLNQWIETATTQASAQTVAIGLQLNSASTLTTTTGILESSHKQFPLNSRAGLIFRAHLNAKGATNCVEEWGFSDQASATAAGHSNGAFFRRDAGGSLQPVLAFNTVETQGTVMTAPATTEYAWYEIFLEDSRATFQIFSAAGVLISSQVMEIGSSAGGAGVATQARMFAVTHLPCFFRTANIGGAAGTAPQIVVNQCIVQLADQMSQRPHIVAQSGLGLNSLTSPTAHTQLANYANSAAPAAATLSNTGAGYTTLGGQWQYIIVAGAETDYALFAWTNPSPYQFFCTGIRIGETVNTGAISGGATYLQWGAAFNSSAVSLATAAPYTPMRVAIGSQSIITAAAIGALAPALQWTPATPVAVFPGRFLHIIVKQVLGTVTASNNLRGTVVIDGFFE